MLSLEEIDNELRKRGVNVDEMSGNTPETQNIVAPLDSMAPLSLDEIDAELARRGVQPEPAKGGFWHDVGEIARGFAKGVGARHEMQPKGHPLYAPYEDEELEKFHPETPYSEMLPEAVGLGKEYEPTTTGGKVRAGIGDFLVPDPNLPLGGYGIYGAGKKGLAKMVGKETALATGMSSAIHGMPRLSQEGTGAGVAEDIGKGILGAGAVNAIPSAVRGGVSLFKKGLSGPEKQVAHHLREIVRPENVLDVTNRIKDYESPIGYKPTTAEIAQNPGLAQIQRAQEGVTGTGIAEHQGRGTDLIYNTLRDLESNEHGMATAQKHIGEKLHKLEGEVQHKVDALGPRIEAPEAGRAIQKGLHETLEQKKGIRRKITNPLYKEVEKMKEELNPVATKKFLRETDAAGDVEKDLNYVKGMLRPRGKLSAQDKAYRTFYEKTIDEYSKMAPKELEKLKESMAKPKSIYPSISRLTKVREAINARIQKYVRGGQDQQALMLRRAKKALDEDLQHVPLYQEATGLYKELSKPVSEITKQPILKKVVKRENKQFTLTESQVPELFVNTASRSIDDAKALLGQVRHDESAMKGVKGYLNNEAAKFIVDPKTEKVDVHKIEAFKRKHPGGKILYPELYDHKLKDVKSAQRMVNQYLKNTESVSKSLYLDALGQYTGASPHRVMKKVFEGNSKEKMHALVETLKKDDANEALEGLRRSTIDHLEKTITNAGAEGEYNKISYPKLKSFMRENKGALDEVLTKDQIGVLQEIEKIVEGKNRAVSMGTAPGSPSSANLRNTFLKSAYSWYNPTPWLVEQVKTLGAGTPFVGKFFEKMRATNQMKIEDTLNRALLDPEYASALLLKPLQGKNEFNQFMKSMNKSANARYLSPLTREYLERKQEKEKSK